MQSTGTSIPDLQEKKSTFFFWVAVEHEIFWALFMGKWAWKGDSLYEKIETCTHNNWAWRIKWIREN